MHHVSVLHLVLFALQAQDTRFASTLFTVQTDVIVVGGDFGPNEALFEVGVNDARALGGFVADFVGPGSDFFFSHIFLNILMKFQSIPG